MFINDIFLERLPKIDLHGYDRDSARVMINDFIDEAFVMGYESVVIVHGIGGGILKKEVHDTLKVNKKVLNYHVDSMNSGCTIVNIKNT